MDVSLTSPANGIVSDREAARPAHAGPERVPAVRREGNFVVGCLVGCVLSGILWAAIGLVVYHLL